MYFLFEIHEVNGHQYFVFSYIFKSIFSSWFLKNYSLSDAPHDVATLVKKMLHLQNKLIKKATYIIKNH